MQLLKSSATALLRSLPAVTRTSRVWKPTLKQTTLSYIQTASIVNISGFEMVRNPRVSTSVLFKLPEIPTTDQKAEYISFHFWEDDEPADVAWTFAIPSGGDLMDILERHVTNMRDETSDEYAGAFKGFVANLILQRLFLGQATNIQDGTCRKNIELPQDDVEKKVQNPVHKKKVSGIARDEEIKRSLQQGQSFVDLQFCFSLTSEFIFREANRLLGQMELKGLMKRNKRGEWSDYEIQWLISQRRQSLPLAKIVRLLWRTKPSVEKKLQQLGSLIFAPTLVEGPQELPPGLRKSIFNARLVDVWQGLLRSEMTPAWKKALSEKPFERWLSTISQGIPEDVQRILGGLQPPTYLALECLSSVDSDNAGVYARLVTSRYEIPTAGERYLYVGSASKYGSGLDGRVSQHIAKQSRKHETRLNRNIRTKSLKAPSRFVNLISMKMDRPEYKDVLDVRRTVTLAEAIFTVWLGALQSPSPHLRNLCPWDLQALDYTAWSSHNPLTVDIVEPIYSMACVEEL